MQLEPGIRTILVRKPFSVVARLDFQPLVSTYVSAIQNHGVDNSHAVPSLDERIRIFINHFETANGIFTAAREENIDF